MAITDGAVEDKDVTILETSLPSPPGSEDCETMVIMEAEEAAEAGVHEWLS